MRVRLSPEVLHGRSPQAILDALTAGSMKYQGLALSGEERRAIAEYLTGRKLRGAVVHQHDRELRASAAAGRSWRESVVERLGPGDRQHALPARRAGAAHRRTGSAAASQVGVRVSRCDVGVGAADDRRRAPVRRQSERHRVCARCRERLRRVDVRGAGRRARVDLDRPSRDSGSDAPASVRGVLLRSEGVRLRGRRGDRPAAVEQEGRRASAGAADRFAGALPGSSVRADLVV